MRDAGRKGTLTAIKTHARAHRGVMPKVASPSVPASTSAGRRALDLDALVAFEGLKRPQPAAASQTPSRTRSRPPSAPAGVAERAARETGTVPLFHNGPDLARTLVGPSPTFPRPPGARVASPFCNADREGAA